MDLSKEEVFTLINAYRNHRVLWDTNHKGYFNKTVKTKAWQTVANSVGVDLENARRKMASLLGSFRRERAKGKKTNDPAGVHYKSDWFAFKAFSFLLDPALNGFSLETGPPPPQPPLLEYANNFEDQPEYDENTTMDGSIQYEETTEDYVTPDVTGTDMLQDTIIAEFPKPIPVPPRKRSRSSQHDNHMEYQPKRECSHRESYAPNESVRRDATAKFARYLEAKLNLFNPTASAILIHKINQLIFETEMSSISQPHAFSMASTSPKSNWTPSPPHISPLVQIDISKYNDKEEEDKKGTIITS